MVFWRLIYDTESLLAVASRIALALAFPSAGWSWIAWFALVPLFSVLQGQKPGAAFQLGWTTGFVFHLASLYWLTHTIGTYTPLTPVGGLVLLALLAATLGTVFGVFAAAVAVVARQSVPAMLFGPLWWVALEWLRARIGGLGFPWLLLGYSQAANPPLMQAAEIAGPYLLSAMIVFANFAVVYALQPGSSVRLRSTVLWSTSIGLMLAHAAGEWRVDQLRQLAPERELRAAVIQGGIEQNLKWDEAYREKTIDIYERLSREAGAKGVDLIVWPETAVPFFYENGGPLRARIEAIARDTGAWLLVGSPAVEHDAVDRARYFNRAYLLRPDGGIAGHYDKRILVPFGEFVPLGSLLFFVDKLVEGLGGFDAGPHRPPLALGRHAMGVQICYEAIFPYLTREQTKDGADVLVNVTNDAWFGDTAAPAQHLAMASFRAVENRRPLLRAANTGISALIEIDGTVVQPTELFTPGYRVYTMSWPLESTFYTRHGDVFAMACALLSSVTVLACLLRRR